MGASHDIGEKTSARSWRDAVPIVIVFDENGGKRRFKSDSRDEDPRSRAFGIFLRAASCFKRPRDRTGRAFHALQPIVPVVTRDDRPLNREYLTLVEICQTRYTNFQLK